ncbi:MAG TPA: hypothetical protein VFK05_06215, partial [Polyangiaceae bacterium]|nr:hypothetical protein [Polyangiaceae bacterium]
FYQTGQSFKHDCFTCTCQADGSVGCSELSCLQECADLQDQYAAALKRAKACDPKQADQCKASVPEYVQCGCSTPANPKNTQALSELKNLASQAEDKCGLADCVACEAPPGPATCTDAGSCEYAPIRAGETACKVGDVTYPSGSSGILKPGDCNTCSCVNGELTSCTKTACPPESACAEGTIPATQCAKCGPTDGCEVVEHACLPTCTDVCQTGMCVSGVCRRVCG